MRRSVRAVVTGLGIGVLAVHLAGLAHAGAPRGAALRSSILRDAKSEAIDDPLDGLRHASDDLRTALRSRSPAWSPEAELAHERAKSVLARTLDHEEMARRVLTSRWASLGNEDRRRFLSLFTQLADRAFMAAMNRPGARFTFESETIIGPAASVLVVASDAGAPATTAGQGLEYRLARSRGSSPLEPERWRVVDVLIGGVSMVDGYREQVERLMNRRGFEALIARMQQKLGETP
jgi:ABC-type transporter MlaC component